MGDDLGNNLLNPGDTPHDNLQFLVFCAAVHPGRRQVAGPAARLASPAPATITGSARTKRRRRSSRSSSATCSRTSSSRSRSGKRHRRPSRAACSTSASRVLPKLPRDAGDRNRTSPFAFTGNKFEFRAVVVGPEHRVAEHLPERGGDRALDCDRHRAREGRRQAARSSKRPCGELLPKVIKQHKRIIFNGNNYSDEWQKEADEARAAEPAQHRRRAARAGQARRHQGLREAQGPQRARAARALRDRLRDLQQDDQRRGAADGADGQPLHPAGGARVPEAGRPGGRRRQGRRRAVEAGQEAARQDAREADRRAARARPTRWPRRSSTTAAAPRSTRSTSATRSSRRWRSCAMPATRSS